MNTHIAKLLTEARAWLRAQGSAEPESPKWYALGNFGSFLDAIEQDSSADSIARAVHALRHHISDQLQWSEDYCKAISEFCAQADRARELT